MGDVKNNNKATLKVLDKKYKDIEIHLQYNPEKYSIAKRVTWSDKKRQKTTPQLQFKEQGRKDLSFELFFDTYEDNTDVRKFTEEIVKLTEPFVEVGKATRPPICLFSWGKLSFKGVLVQVTQNFTLFSRHGIPLRARLTVSMKQFTTAKDEAKGTMPCDPEKIWIVKEGDRLSSISDKEFGSPHLWRHIADENKIVNPRQLKPGQVLILPALE